MKEERQSKRRVRKIKFWLKVLIFLAIVSAVVFALKSPYFQVKEYEIEGNSYYTDAEILTMGNCQTGGNIFIGTDLDDIKARLLKDPYNEKVKVKRTLPNKITVKIQERTQNAAIAYGENYIVIDGDCTMLRKTSVRPKMTIIKGVTISKLKLGETIEVEEPKTLERALNIVSVMEKHDMYFTILEMGSNVIKAHILDNLVCEGTYSNVVSSMEAGYLAHTVQELFNQGIERGTIKVNGNEYISFTPKVD